METEYRRDLAHLWLILSGGELPEPESYPIRMLEENRIPGLLPGHLTSLDGSIRFYYDISSGQTLSVRLQDAAVKRELLEDLLSSLSELLEQLEDHLLDPDGLLLSPDRIFLSPGRPCVRYCYYPEKGRDLTGQLRLLSEALLPHLDHSDEAAVLIGYSFYQRCSEGVVSADIFRELIRAEAKPERRTAKQKEWEHAELMDAFFAPEEEEIPPAVKLWEKIRKWGPARRIFRSREQTAPGDAAIPGGAGPDPVGEVSAGRKTWPPDGGSGQSDRAEPAAEHPVGTTLLTPEMRKGRQTVPAWLEPADGGGGTVVLGKERYLIGQTAGSADLALPSEAVSRNHARLECREGSYALMDLNSRNGTWVNETPLLPEQTVFLRDGDRVRFADLEYCYRCGRSGT